ncbi:hypothetical protein PGT21_025351 [Puccinia graminis f. sp. tritici]|uniref:Uncharacterized protein n=1 Tax=Puccinia graminis f. sp. tritici TaxID=56615 RepID=A0A5B0LWP9_PUCGR|nr:hypothetical protein PGT21_025351 [Puccinia graminis f. sp. tritici]
MPSKGTQTHLKPKHTQTKPKPKPPQHPLNPPVKLSAPDPDTHDIPLDPQVLKSGISQEEENPQQPEKLSGQLIEIKPKLAALKSPKREIQLEKIFQILDGSATVIDIKQAPKKHGAPKLENVANQKKRKLQENNPILSILKRKPKQVKTSNLTQVQPASKHFPHFELSEAPYLIGYLPTFMENCVKDVFSVGNNGHCGFHATSYCLGRSQNNWFNS